MEYMEWNGVVWSGMEWNGVEWSGMEWSEVELEWNGNSELTQTDTIQNLRAVCLASADHYVICLHIWGHNQSEINLQINSTSDSYALLLLHHEITKSFA